MIVLLPAKDEAIGLAKTIDDIKEMKLDCEIVVIDNASTDDTAKVALSKGATLIYEPVPGKGNALRTAFAQCGGDSLIMMDSDWTYPASAIPAIVDRLLNAKADVVMCYREEKELDSMSSTNRFGNWFLSSLASILYGFRVRDICTGMQGFRAGTLAKFTLTSTGFTIEADLFVNSIRKGCKISQVPIRYRKRVGGPPKLHLLDGFKIAWFLLRKRFGGGR